MMKGFIFLVSAIDQVGMLYVRYTVGDTHVEDLQLDNHETCQNDVHHDHAHEGHHHGSDHHHSSDKKITGTQNKILQGEMAR